MGCCHFGRKKTGGQRGEGGWVGVVGWGGEWVGFGGVGGGCWQVMKTVGVMEDCGGRR